MYVSCGPACFETKNAVDCTILGCMRDHTLISQRPSFPPHKARLTSRQPLFSSRWKAWWFLRKGPVMPRSRTHANVANPLCCTTRAPGTPHPKRDMPSNIIAIVQASWIVEASMSRLAGGELLDTPDASLQPVYSYLVQSLALQVSFQSTEPKAAQECFTRKRTSLTICVDAEYLAF